MMLIASILFSTGGILCKLIPWSPLAINGVRNLLGGLLIAAYLLATHHKLRFNFKILIGAICMCGVTTLFIVANKLTTAANAIVLQYSAPIWIIILSALILKKTGMVGLESFHTVHNYIDTDEMILRKGAIAAHAGERVLIPINMRDGALICVGKGNPDWNESAPHGAGRLMSRTDARSSISMKAYKDAMKGIYTTCVNKGTLDESPFAYKPMDEIVTNIEPTAEIVSKIKPIYNFKAGDEE